VVSEIKYLPDLTSAGAVIDMGVEAYDEDRDPLEYLWESSHGEFLSSKQLDKVVWKAPLDGEGLHINISVIVSDGEHDIIREAKFNLTEALLGSVEGHVVFRNTNIQLSDVKISIADKETNSDNEGYFLISGLVAGKDSIFASKSDYNTNATSITVIQDKTLDLDLELLSIVHSSKTFGVVQDQDGEKVEYAQVIMLNPDGSESRLQSYTNEQGLFRISYIPHGLRTILVRKEHNDSERFEESKIEVEFAEMEQELNLVITKETLIGEFNDPRDNQIYSFRKIGDLVWMTENLAYLPQVSHPSTKSESEPHYYVSDYYHSHLEGARSHSSYLKYGVLYNWVAAKQSCPPGWFFPSNWEYTVLGKSLGDQAGHNMKSQSGWYDLGNGNNTSGFSAIPGGNLTASDDFSGLGKHAFFYTTTNDDNNNAYYFNLSYDSDELTMKSASKKNGFSVRCVKIEN